MKLKLKYKLQTNYILETKIKNNKIKLKLKNTINNQYECSATASYYPKDNFNFETGFSIAYNRLLKKLDRKKYIVYKNVKFPIGNFAKFGFMGEKLHTGDIIKIFSITQQQFKYDIIINSNSTFSNITLDDFGISIYNDFKKRPEIQYSLYKSFKDCTINDYKSINKFIEIID